MILSLTLQIPTNQYVRALATSYAFHKTIESPLTFARREWRSIAIFGGAFCAILLVAILSVDPAYFYPRMITDALKYYLKGLALVETGHTRAFIAVNAEPMQYVSMPGVLRAPFIAAFSDFDQRLRAIQIANVAILAAVALLNAYIVSWILPQRYHWLAIGLAFASVLASPMWLSNAFAPLADSPFALFSGVAIVLIVRAICAEHSPPMRYAIALGAVVAVILASSIRLTGPILVGFAAALAFGRLKPGRITRWVPLMLLGVLAVALAAFLALNWNAALFYLAQPLFFLRKANKVGLILNLVALGIPAQIIPDFFLAYDRPPVGDPKYALFTTNPVNASLTIVGVAITVVVAIGLWRSRKRFAPEIIYLAVPMPIIGILLPSTPRYLLTYQPIIWVFFIAGIVSMAEWLSRHAPRLARHKLALATPFMIIAAGAFMLRLERIGTASALGGRAFAVGETRAYANEVSSTFRDLRGFLESLPRDRTLLLTRSQERGTWKAIAGMNYYSPDSNLSNVVNRYEVYNVIQCATRAACATMKAYGRVDVLMARFGRFSSDSVFGRTTPHARVVVYRIRTMGDSRSRETPYTPTATH